MMRKTIAPGVALAMLAPAAAVAQSAGCLDIDGFASEVLQVRLSTTLSALSFDPGEVVTLSATSVRSSQEVGTPVWGFADTARTGSFGDGAISPTFPSSDTPVSETLTVPDGGIEGLALVEFGPWFTDLDGVAVACGLPAANRTGPAPDEEIAHLAAGAGTAGRIVVLGARSLSGRRAQESLATRGARAPFSFATAADPDRPVAAGSTKTPSALMGNVHAWFDVSGFSATDDDTARSFGGTGIQIGADLPLRHDMVAGVSLGYQDLSSDVDAFSQEGDLRFVQIYTGYRSGKWSGEATLLYGQGRYAQTSRGGDGEGETRLAAATIDGGYDVVLDDAMTLRPRFGLAHGVEEAEGVSGTLADAGKERTRFTEASLGAELARAVSGGEVSAALFADWLDTSSDAALVSDLLVDDGWTGRVSLGMSADIGDGMRLDTSFALSGLGGDLQQTSGALRVTLRF